LGVEETVERSSCAFERSFVAYGQRYGLRAQDGDLLDRLAARVPLGWHASAVNSPEISTWYVLRRADDADAPYRLTVGGECVIESLNLPLVLDTFERHAELLAAERARDSLFVHAGVVAWHDRAIVMPGASGSGKTTLVRAFLAAGATYLSDEYAPLDRHGFVNPYARPLSIRRSHQHRESFTAADLGSRNGTASLPVGVVLLTSYQPDAMWNPRRLSAANTVVKLMAHTVAARRNPEYAMGILKAVATQAIALESMRPEADLVVGSVLSVSSEFLKFLERYSCESSHLVSRREPD
jgi:hypothetical protein